MRKIKRTVAKNESHLKFLRKEVAKKTKWIEDSTTKYVNPIIDEVKAREHNLDRLKNAERVPPHRAIMRAMKDSGDTLQVRSKKCGTSVATIENLRNKWTHKTRFLTVQTMCDRLGVELAFVSRDGEIFPMEKMPVKYFGLKPEEKYAYDPNKQRFRDDDPGNFFR